jgi:hypothetical protein
MVIGPCGLDVIRSHGRMSRRGLAGRSVRRDPVIFPLGGDQRGRRYRLIASFTQGAKPRLSTSHSTANSVFSPPQPAQLRPLILIERAGPIALPPLVGVQRVARGARAE